MPKISLLKSYQIFMGYSKTHFMTIFKQHYRYLFCRIYHSKARLNAACEELRNSIKPVFEIATNVGFNNLSNFNRQFKHYYDQTPSQYRKHIATRRNKKELAKWLLSFYICKLLSFSLYLVFPLSPKRVSNIPSPRRPACELLSPVVGRTSV